MNHNILYFDKDRVLFLRPIGEPIENIKADIVKPFAVMLPAYNDAEQSVAKDIIAALVDFGCVEFCCVGRQAEELHDAIDWIIEDKNALSVITTWHEDIAEACEYFVYTAGSAPKCLLALIAEDSEIVVVLRRLMAENFGERRGATGSRNLTKDR